MGPFVVVVAVAVGEQQQVDTRVVSLVHFFLDGVVVRSCDSCCPWEVQVLLEDCWVSIGMVVVAMVVGDVAVIAVVAVVGGEVIGAVVELAGDCPC